MSESKRVSISLLTWNGARYIPWLIKSLENQTYTDWELFVLDNDSSDNSIEVVKQAIPKASIIQKTKNVGFARGHNLIINWSDSEYILVINQDILLDENYLAETVKFMDEHPEVASVSGKVMYWDFNEGNKSKTIDSFGIKMDRRRYAFDLHQGKKDFITEDKQVFGLSGAVLLLRRKAMETIGWPSDGNHIEYFDEDFFAYKEDIDLAWRLRIAGWQNWLIKSTRAYHHRSVSGGKDIKSLRKGRSLANKFSYRNHLMMLYKNSFYKNLLRDFWPIKWYKFKKFVYLLIFERSTLAGIGEYTKLLPKLSRKRKFIMSHARVKADDIYKWFKD